MEKIYFYKIYLCHRILKNAKFWLKNSRFYEKERETNLHRRSL